MLPAGRRCSPRLAFAIRVRHTVNEDAAKVGKLLSRLLPGDINPSNEGTRLSALFSTRAFIVGGQSAPPDAPAWSAHVRPFFSALAHALISFNQGGVRISQCRFIS